MRPRAGEARCRTTAPSKRTLLDERFVGRIMTRQVQPKRIVKCLAFFGHSGRSRGYRFTAEDMQTRKALPGEDMQIKKGASSPSKMKEGLGTSPRLAEDRQHV